MLLMCCGFRKSGREKGWQRLSKLKQPITIMHPGPINRGVEIDTDVADSEHSIILHQVLNGVAVRMSILYLLAGGR